MKKNVAKPTEMQLSGRELIRSRHPLFLTTPYTHPQDATPIHVPPHSCVLPFLPNPSTFSSKALNLFLHFLKLLDDVR